MIFSSDPIVGFKGKNNGFFLIVAAFLFLFFLFLVSPSFSNFFDYKVYNTYIESGSYFRRFNLEPLSALLMHLSYSLGLGATSYYFFTTVIFVASLFFFSFSVLKNLSALLFFGAVLFSPATLILLHTPRYVLALAFFFFAILFLEKRRYLLCLWSVALSILSHTAGGLVSAAFFVMFMMTPLFQGIAVITLLIVFYATLVGAFDFIAPFSVYSNEEHNRGVGRLLIAVVTFFFSFLIFKGKSNIRFYLFSLFCLTLFFYYLTPYAHRILYFVVFFSLLYFMLNSKTLFSKALIIFYFLFSGIISIYIVEEGLYGY